MTAAHQHRSSTPRKGSQRLAPVVAGLLAVIALTSCSDDGRELAEPTRTTPSTVVAEPSPTSSGAATASSAPESSASTLPGETAPIAPPTFPVVTVPEVGVPGLDSVDQFCSSWSRFGGSFQVVSVASAFLSDDPAAAFGVEVAAAPVVTDSFQQLLANWPDELADEFDVVSDTVFGPFAERARVAVDALLAAGATEADLATMSEAWVAALAQRDPSTPEIALVLPTDVQTLVDTAAAQYGADRPSVFSDPALVNEVATPLTDQYLAVSCPDQGSLAGGEVDG